MPVVQNSSLKRLIPQAGSASAHRPHNGTLGVHPAGSQKYGSRNLQNRGYREDEGEQPTPLLQLPPLCIDW